MTEERREFVAENHNLIYSFARNKNLDLEEYYDLLAIGLCKAGCLYDFEKGFKFSSLAYTCMDNEVRMYWRNLQLVGHIPESLICSYDEPLDNGDDKVDSLGMLHYLKDEKVDPDVSEVYVQEFISSLDERKRKVLLDYIDGYSEREIGVALGVSRTIVSREIHKIRNLWKSYNKSIQFNFLK